MTFAKSSATVTRLPVTFAESPVTFAKSSATVTRLPVTFAKSPVTFAKSPVTFAKSPVTFAKSRETQARSPAVVTKSLAARRSAYASTRSYSLSFSRSRHCPPSRIRSRVRRVLSHVPNAETLVENRYFGKPLGLEFLRELT